MIVAALLACSAPAPSGGFAIPAGAEPAAEPAAAEASGLQPGPPLRGLCDASAGVWVDGRLWVADDETDVLRAFDVSGSEVDRFDIDALLGGFPKESDLEGVAMADGGVWWIGSHDRGGKGVEPVPARQQLARAQLGAKQIDVRRDDLLARLAAHPEVGALLAATAGKGSKDPGGFSIEGLAAEGGSLWIGLRAPVVDGDAVLVRLDDPAGAAAVGAVRRVDLGGRGIRALELFRGGLWAIAGDPGDGDASFVLAALTDAGATIAPVSFGDLRPEGLAADGDRLWLLSDDGGVDVGGAACKRLPPEQRRARTAWWRP